jgi:hypothetical protein
VPTRSSVLAERPVLVAATEALSGATDVTGFELVSRGAVLEVASQRPVLSPQFEPRAEAEMASTLRDVAASLPGARSGVIAIEEFRGPWGVPDLAALTPARVQQRLSCGVPPLLSENDCRLLAAASRWTEVAALAALARISARPAQRQVSRLASVGALDKRGSQVRRNPAIVTLGRLWAIEAKTEDWQSGLSQVHRYRLWRVPVEVIAAQAHHYRVGVIVGGRWVARPRVVLPVAATRLLASEHMLAALIGAAPSSGA